MNIQSLFIYSSISFLIAFLIFPIQIKLLRQWKVLDSPGKHKIHEDFKPSMGGLPIVIAVAFSLLIALSLHELAKYKYFFLAISLMIITGLRDDILTLSPRQKMLSQFLPLIILVVFGGAVLTSFYELSETWVFNKYAAWLITFFTILILTNAYNLIDGIDGLAGTVGVIVLTSLGLWFYNIDQWTLALISFSFSSALLAFLFFNWQPSKIFMGDTGALTIGFLFSYLIIQFINANHGLPAENSFKFQASISSAICILIIPIFDTLRVIILRLRKLQSPFYADKNHLHHQFLNLGLSHAASVFWLMAINLCFIVLAWALRSQPDTVILPIVIGLCLAINYALRYAKLKHEKNERTS